MFILAKDAERNLQIVIPIVSIAAPVVLHALGNERESRIDSGNTSSKLILAGAGTEQREVEEIPMVVSSLTMEDSALGHIGSLGNCTMGRYRKVFRFVISAMFPPALTLTIFSLVLILTTCWMRSEKGGLKHLTIEANVTA